MDTTGALSRVNRVTLKPLGDGDGGCGGRGKFLLVRTVSPLALDVELGGGDTLIVAVTDPEASRKTNLSLKNYSLAIFNKEGVDLDLEDVLPQGTYLALKNLNPTKNPLSFHNPSDVLFMSPKDVEAVMGQDFTWSPLDEQDDPRSFWTAKIEETGVGVFCFGFGLVILFNKLRACGNKLFVSGCYSDAIRFYDLALQYASTDKEKSMTLSNKAAALVRFGCYTAASKEARLAIQLDAGNSKAICRLAQALLGLGEFGLAVDLLQSRLNDVSCDMKDKEAVETLLKAAERRRDAPPIPTADEYIALSSLCTKVIFKSKHTMPPTIFDPALLEGIKDNLKEYVGPVEIRKCDSSATGKERGLFATEDISPGQVLLISRALAFHKCDDVIMKIGPEGSSCLGHLVTQMANKINCDPSLASQAYQFSGAAEESGCLENSPYINSNATALVDVDRILAVLRKNYFVIKSKSSTRKHHGFYPLPSFINHSCSEFNCTNDTFDGINIVKAVKSIAKDSEVLFTYVDEFLSYEEREALLKAHYGLTCTCKLCTWELSQEDTALGLRHASLKRILRQHNKNMENLDRTWRELLPETHFLEGLWSGLSLPGLVPVPGIELLMAYLVNLGLKKGERQPITFALNIGNFILSLTTHGPERVANRMILHTCFSILDMREEMVANMRAMKEDLVLWYGSVEGIHILGGTIVKELEENGIDFYSV